jgi:hypothetical protein
VLRESVPGPARRQGQRERVREAADQRMHVTTWRWIGSIKLVVSLLLSARGLGSGEGQVAHG